MGPNAPLFYEDPLYLVSGQGVWLYDNDGRRYLDAYNNVPHVGHSHPAITEAVSSQIGTLNTHSRYLSKVVLDYHEQLLSTFDFPEASVILTCTGSEANELALRMARFITGNRGVIVMDYTYHGNTTAVSEISTAYSGKGADAVNLPPHVRTIRVPTSRCFQGEQTDAAQFSAKTRESFLGDIQAALAHFKESEIGVAALLIDPIFSTEGLPDIPDGCVRDAVSLVRQAGGIYIADEVQPGLGRTGDHWWGYQVHGVLPDIVTLGKSLGNGYPIAGVVARKDLLKAFRENVMYFNTYGANPVACAAGTAVLQVIEQENLIHNARETGEFLRKKLRSLASAHDCLGEVRGSGLFIGVEIVKNIPAPQPDPHQTRTIVEGMKRAGVLVSKIGKHENVLKIRPPMPFSPQNVQLFVDTLDTILSQPTPR
jgi:4-aminobutyrate aminotransferase-like enzyme